ncbi:MAG: nicotinate-nicotinamide nucleotide adenylyltransferase [Bacilli bacterium]|nr:nicotinate-nicotinamide nucleotide adenylyltransferase [Bacilli bacterium]MDD4036494.1 nicotinate-nicotinamide nucleotide adenylyltransferase [Bacilli bacterium]
MRIGVYVGSFNPVHKGHKYVIDYLLDNNYVDKVEVVPTSNYWNKNNLLDIKNRIKMLKFYETDKIIINEELNNLEYTYQVLRELDDKNNELYLIIGSDNLPKFHLWERINEILNYKIIVCQRDNLKMEDYIKQFKNNKNFILIDNFREFDISSTNIRSLIEKNNVSELGNFLDERVLDFIIKNNLYSGKK